ncbi:MAG: hypothetical protein JRF56_05365 [Deltaproteobacteria bacterium]|jgi:hypothetical protein|nr:hypothetical protein [Deltaproteobacteria bacterium]
MLPDIKFDEDLFDVDGMQNNKGWLICDHFEDLKDILNHYKNFHPLIVFSGTILCENCYRNIVEGKHPQINESKFEITDARFKTIFGEALIEANKKMQGSLLIGC